MGIAEGIIGGSLIGAGASIFGANKQAKAAEQASQTAQDTQMQMFNQQNALQEPFRQAGMTGQNRLMELLGIGGNQGAQGYGMYAAPPTQADIQQDPGYGFRFNEGMKAMNQTAAARGGLMSGNALKAGQRYGQDMGSQEYGNAYNRYMATKNSMLGPLQSLGGVGQSSANTMTQAAGQYGNNLAGIQSQGITDSAAARASGYMGGANAISGGIGQYLNNQMSQNYMNMLRSNNQMPITSPYSNNYFPSYVGQPATPEWVSQG